ncbi:MAG: hypothetical protein GY803_25310 [Chloroflexi bacterium]|nr:hypothetical protein [Chloroflexota bacterium]
MEQAIAAETAAHTDGTTSRLSDTLLADIITHHAAHAAAGDVKFRFAL